MVYVMSDIHGCYQEFLELLKLIEFSEQDELYILGDMLDRGPSPISLLLDLMMRPNVYPMLGNHDYMALAVLKKLNVEITEENFESHLSQDDFVNYMYWMEDGGGTTVNQFARLDKGEREAVLEYLEECTVLEEIKIKGRRYILVHADMPLRDAGGRLADTKQSAGRDGADVVEPDRGERDVGGLNETLVYVRDGGIVEELCSYDLAELIFHRADYERRYFEDESTFLVTGHTPTFGIRADGRPLVYEENGHVAIDCGCVFGGNLAAYRLNDHKAFYVGSHGGIGSGKSGDDGK
jgi:serine/threonine protein phosphatase 1